MDVPSPGRKSVFTENLEPIDRFNLGFLFRKIQKKTGNSQHTSTSCFGTKTKLNSNQAAKMKMDSKYRTRSARGNQSIDITDQAVVPMLQPPTGTPERMPISNETPELVLISRRRVETTTTEPDPGSNIRSDDITEQAQSFSSFSFQTGGDHLDINTQTATPLVDNDTQTAVPLDTDTSVAAPLDKNSLSLSYDSDSDIAVYSSESEVEAEIRSWGAKEMLGEAGAGPISKVQLWSGTRDMKGERVEGELVGEDGMIGDEESESGSEVEEYPRAVLRRTMTPDDASQSTDTYAHEDSVSDASVREDSVSYGSGTAVPEPARVPDWFPENIRKIYATDHHGGALTFKELSTITHYRTMIDIVRRRKWKSYIEAGQARWKLQKTVHKLRSQGHISTSGLLEMRVKQYSKWKIEALARWKKLEKYQLAALVLDETINTNFLMERVIYRKKLDGGK